MTGHERPLRLLVYDRTCTGRPGLSDAWRHGAGLYRRLGRLDDAFGAANWTEALDWLLERSARRPIAQVQYWGHGRRGRALIESDVFDVAGLNARRAQLERLRARCVPGAAQALLWFRTCETFGGHSGHSFAQALADFFAAPVAGHTHVIGFWQSGLHRLLPGQRPHWSTDEGVASGDEDAVALDSSPRLPFTIHCLQGSFPSSW